MRHARVALQPTHCQHIIAIKRTTLKNIRKWLNKHNQKKNKHSQMKNQKMVAILKAHIKTMKFYSCAQCSMVSLLFNTSKPSGKLYAILSRLIEYGEQIMWFHCKFTFILCYCDFNIVRAAFTLLCCRCQSTALSRFLTYHFLLILSSPAHPWNLSCIRLFQFFSWHFRLSFA